MDGLHPAGQSVRQSARRLQIEAGRRMLLCALLLFGAVVVAAEGSGKFGLLLAGGASVVALEARKRLRFSRAFRLGAISEARVGAVLDPLEERGWIVAHDLAKEGGGNVDHLVHSPGVTFVIDTKRSRWRDTDLAQAHRHVAWAMRRYGRGRDIVPVICIQRSESRPRLIGDVIVVGEPWLNDCLCDRG